MGDGGGESPVFETQHRFIQAEHATMSSFSKKASAKWNQLVGNEPEPEETGILAGVREGEEEGERLREERRVCLVCVCVCVCV